MTQAISKLDDSQASLRLLIVLCDYEDGINQQNLYGQMKVRYKVGRGAVDSAIAICVDLGLVELVIGRQKPKASISHRLTHEGKEIASLCEEIAIRLGER